jgi:MGT family glycosyltransferase
LPAWVEQLPALPTIYFTLGTVFNIESGDLFARVLAGLRDLPINVIATVGREIDPIEFGQQPPHIHIEQYIPQALILPQCVVSISHGGSGSVMGALAHGLPMVLLPMGADQPQNAARCEALRVARVLDVIDATPKIIREAINDILENPAYRRAAQRMKDEIAALPPPAHAVELLEQLAAENRPLFT